MRILHAPRVLFEASNGQKHLTNRCNSPQPDENGDSYVATFGFSEVSCQEKECREFDWNDLLTDEWEKEESDDNS